MTDPAHCLLERDTELALLRTRLAALRRSAGTGGCCVLVQGDAGSGKTSLLNAARAADSDGVLWLQGACEPMLAPPPFAPLIELLDALPPSLARAVRAGRQSPEVLAGVLELLRDRPGPTVLAIDDAHWADGATLDLLRWIGRRIEAARALLVLAFRAAEVVAGDPLHEVLAALPARTTLRLDLRPLSAAAVSQLACRAGRDGGPVWEVTRGHPFFVVELLAAPPGKLPAAVRDVVLARVARLPAPARELLELASMVPGPLEIGVADAILDAAGTSAMVCVAAGLLEPAGDGVVFRHELARRAVAGALGADRAAALHGAVFDALSLHDVPAARLVHHAAHAGLGAAVLRLAPRAARDAAAVGDHRQAARLYALALAARPVVPDGQRAALLMARAEAERLTGGIDAAVDACREALALHQQLDEALAAGRDERMLAGLEWFRGHIDAAQQHARSALRTLIRHRAVHRERGLAWATLAQLHLLGPTAEPAVRHGRRALLLLERAADADGLAYVLNTLGSAELRTADTPQGWQRLRRSLAIALEAGLVEHAARAYANLASLGLVHRRAGQVDEACSAGIAYCEERDLDMYLSRLRIRSACARIGDGRWAEAAVELARVRAVPGLTPVDAEQHARLAALLALRRGEPGAAAYWDEVRSGRRRMAIDPWYAPQAIQHAEACWMAGDLNTLVEAAQVALAEAMPTRERWRIGQLACWLQRAGSAQPLPVLTLPAPCALELAGDLPGAAAAWAAIGCRYEQALVLAGGDAAALREALELAEGLGAVPRAHIVRTRLRALGARGVRRGPYGHRRDDPQSLTERERLVYTLVCQGLGNGAIAARLHRSERTIEHHVSSLLAKLGVASRAAAIALQVAAQKQVAGD